MNNDDERDYAEEAANQALLMSNDGEREDSDIAYIAYISDVLLNGNPWDSRVDCDFTTERYIAEEVARMHAIIEFHPDPDISDNSSTIRKASESLLKAAIKAAYPYCHSSDVYEYLVYSLRYGPMTVEFASQCSNGFYVDPYNELCNSDIVFVKEQTGILRGSPDNYDFLIEMYDRTIYGVGYQDLTFLRYDDENHPIWEYNAS